MDEFELFEDLYSAERTEDEEEISCEIIDSSGPYIIEEVVKKFKRFKYNPNYGDDRYCSCGHTYYRHFDPWNNMCASGCKHCGCSNFTEITKEQFDAAMQFEKYFDDYDDSFNDGCFEDIDVTESEFEIDVYFILKNRERIRKKYGW